MLYFRHTLAVNVEVGDFLFWFVIFFGLVLSLKLQKELSEIHRSQNGVSYLKSRVSHWSGEKVLEPIKNSLRPALRFAPRSTRMISRVRSDPWAPGAAAEVRSDAQTDYAVEVRSDPQFPSVQTSRWLAAFFLCDLLIGLLFPLCDCADWLCQYMDEPTDIWLIE